MYNSEKVVALIVTYGERRDLLSRVISNLEDIGVKKIVVVANMVGENTKNYLTRQEMQKNISVCWSQTNTGSSGGISIGIEYVTRNLEFSYVWMLDDDNLPRIDSLNELLRIASEVDDKSFAFHSYRENQEQNVEQVSWIFPKRSSFFEFDIFTLLKRFLRKINKMIRKSENTLPTVFEVPYAPYGGLFISKELVERIGTPNPEFFLYVDDTEYTFRIAKLGGKVLMVMDSRICDIDDYWGKIYPMPRLFTQFLFEEPYFRSYYSLRNHAFFDKNIWSTNKLLYQLNKTTFILILFSLAVFYGKTGRFKALLSTIAEGERGDLGVRKIT